MASGGGAAVGYVLGYGYDGMSFGARVGYTNGLGALPRASFELYFEAKGAGSGDHPASYNSKASVSNLTVQIKPEGDLKMGDRLLLSVRTYLPAASDVPGTMEHSLSIDDNGQTITFSTGVDPAHVDLTKTLHVKIGDTITVSGVHAQSASVSSGGSDYGWGLGVISDWFVSLDTTPDLGVSTPKWTAGQGVDFTYTVSGTSPPRPTKVGLYWSADDKFDNDPTVDKSAYGPIDTKTAQGTYDVPVNHDQLTAQPSDAKYLLAVIDPDNTVAESDETNNVRVLNVQPELTGTFTSVPPTVTPGKTISVSINVNNSGQGRANGMINVGFYLSKDGTLDANDTPIGMLPIQINLALGESIPFSTGITIPNSVAGGVYRLITKVDDSNEIDESDEGNNTTVSDPRTIRRLSGDEWVNAFPGSKSLDRLDSGFARNVITFITAAETGGAKVDIIATYRPPERAYLMHWSWLIAKQNYPANSVPPMDGVYIEWWHGDQARSKAAAQSMVDGFGINKLKVAPALSSNHTLGLAIDMSITWTRRLTVIDGNGVKRTIRGWPRDSTNKHLIDIGKTYGVIHFINAYKDKNHWSINGR